MKESGMDKLLKLLNEYDGDVLEYGFVDGEIKRKVKNFNNEENTWKEVVWYTKQFGFIKWLVDNDKIDFSREGDLAIELVNLFERKLNNTEGVIALLSIKDNPIEFLISILKDKKVRTVYVDKDGNVSGDTKQYSDC